MLGKHYTTELLPQSLFFLKWDYLSLFAALFSTYFILRKQNKISLGPTHMICVTYYRFPSPHFFI
jgi:hypothetical protein